MKKGGELILKSARYYEKNLVSIVNCYGLSIWGKDEEIMLIV
ncbi:hypothetical protein CLOSYM_00361 [[Clostridium] symbiosum ATCC 14940]|uniref:Uncharacterized protein n=1 Tax=[Clostridium] symbiosum ATCC 14940 TaxID=411472 RepID=A0ABC9U355_CLOSY|nr:hypothetical protein CLOSYM_00361 [[Clostridium] symbiosum ATCC 14940]